MNLWDLSVSDLLIWGLVLHLVADWPLQNDWMVQNKESLRHPAGYVHAGIHGLWLSTVFGWVAIPLAVTHLLIDTRKPVIWWSQLIGQVQPSGKRASSWAGYLDQRPVSVVDIGLEVRFWTDQVFHIVCVAIAALIVA